MEANTVALAEYLYGRNAVRECLQAQRRHIHKLELTKGLKTTGIVAEIVQLAQSLRIPVQYVSKQKLDTQTNGHQGVLLQVGRLPALRPNDLLTYAYKSNEPAFILALDHLEDPHNVGALLRTADAVGVHGVILPSRRAAGITAAVAKASAGATEHVPICIVPNLVQSLNLLKEENVWVVGVEKSAQAQPYHQASLDMPLVLVLGNEGTGLTRLVSRTCDLLLELPMKGQIASLNVSVAGALALYEVWRSRKFLA